MVLDVFRSFKVCADAKERVECEKQWEALVPEFAVGELPLGRTAALVPEFTVKDLTLGSIVC